MKSKLPILVASAAVVGILGGAILTSGAHAQSSSTGPDTSAPPSASESQQKEQTYRTHMQNTTRTATKTDQGIQININGNDQAATDWLHQQYDANGGTWPGKGMGRHGRHSRPNDNDADDAPGSTNSSTSGSVNPSSASI